MDDDDLTEGDPIGNDYAVAFPRSVTDVDEAGDTIARILGVEMERRESYFVGFYCLGKHGDVTIQVSQNCEPDDPEPFFPQVSGQRLLLRLSGPPEQVMTLIAEVEASLPGMQRLERQPEALTQSCDDDPHADHSPPRGLPTGWLLPLARSARGRGHVRRDTPRRLDARRRIDATRWRWSGRRGRRAGRKRDQST